jgi:hypothetical protein
MAPPEESLLNNSDKTGHVKSTENYKRLAEGLAPDKRRGVPLPEIKEGSEYMLNVGMINKMLASHDMFTDGMKRRLKDLIDGVDVNSSTINPLLT